MAEYIKVPAGVYDMVTRCMEQEFPDHVAIRYVAEDGKTVVEKKYREYAQDIRRMVAYLKAEVPDIKGRRIVLLSRNCYEFCVASYGIILAGGVLVTLNQKKTWEELEYELGLVEPALILNDGIDYGCRAELEAAYGPKLRPMDCYKETAPGELTNCVGHDDLMMLMFTSGCAFVDAVFEACSAFSLGGYSVGVASAGNPASLFILSAEMIVGRLGPLTIAYSISRPLAPEPIRYPQENIIVG